MIRVNSAKLAFLAGSVVAQGARWGLLRLPVETNSLNQLRLTLCLAEFAG